jgi:hypothetical protein
MVRGELPDNSMPTIVLDATAPVETYKELFGNRQVTVWPEEEPPAPKSEVVQMTDGLYPLSTLLREEDDELLAADALKSIVQEIRQAQQALGVAEHEMGLITLKKVRPFLERAFPQAIHMHYGALRGLNGMRDCRLVALVGCQPPSDQALAWQTACLFRLNQTPETLITKRRNGSHARKWTPVKAENGDGYEVNAIDLRDPRLNLAWDICVTSEVVQGLGRARPYEERAERQTVLVYCNQPLHMPVSKACTRAEFRESLGVGEKPEGIAKRVLDAMQALKNEDGTFGYKEIAGKLNVGEGTLKKKEEYGNAVKKACVELNLDFKQGGDGQNGTFLP